MFDLADGARHACGHQTLEGCQSGVGIATNLGSDCFVSSSYSARLEFRAVGNPAAFHPPTSLGRLRI